MQKFKFDLLSLFDANIPIIHIPTYDFYTVDNLIGNIFQDVEISEFHIGNRLVDFQTKKRIRHSKFTDVLENFDSQESIENSILILKDIECFLQNDINSFYLKSLAFKKMYQDNFNLTIIIIAKNLKVKTDLDKFITTLDFPLPKENEILEILNDFINSMKINNLVCDKNELVKYLKGLDRVEILEILNKNYQQTGTLNIQNINIKEVRSLELIKRNPLLEYINTSEHFNQVGGLAQIKNYFMKISKIYSNYERAIKFKVDVPKGIVIFGADGLGKGLLVKASSNLLKLPIISFNFEKIKSENEIKTILKDVTTFGESILWIKGVSENKYILQILLNWLGQNSKKIFTILTNETWDCKLRRGYFDEVFELKLPTENERFEIFKIHLKKRDKDSNTLNIYEMVKFSQNMNSAEIEYGIKRAIEKTFLEAERNLTTEDIISELYFKEPIVVPNE